MSKFRIKMKLTGLELEIEGTREEMPQIAHNLGRQFTGLLQPAAGIVEGEVLPSDRRIVPPAAPPAPSPDGGSQATRKRKSGKKRTAASTPFAAATSGTTPTDLVVEFTHDPTRFGLPRQEWSTTQKAIWLLYIVGEQAGRRELTAHQIEATFNRQFREAKQILIQNIARDLGKQRAKGKDAPVAEDTTMDPSPWYLVEAGRREAQALVVQALARPSEAGDPGNVDASTESGGE